MAGYSGTPLPKKLGFTPDMTVEVLDAPDEYASWLGEAAPQTVELGTQKVLEAAHVFVRDAKTLRRILPGMRKRMKPDAFVWVSWPKKSSKVPTDVTEDTIREVALPLGLVDVKVCAVSDVWSGLKLVIRRSER